MKIINLVGKLGKGKVVIIDDIDFEKIKKYLWYWLPYKKHGYAWAKVNKKTLLLHRFILNTPKKMVTDHKNGNGLDNRRENIRICTMSENLIYKGKLINNTTGYKGVYHEKRSKRNPWFVRLMVKGKLYCLGCYKTKTDAALAYNKAALKYHGKFAYLNKII